MNSRQVTAQLSDRQMGFMVAGVAVLLLIHVVYQLATGQVQLKQSKQPLSEAWGWLVAEGVVAIITLVIGLCLV